MKYLISMFLLFCLLGKAYAEVHKTKIISTRFTKNHAFWMHIEVENGKLVSVKGKGAKLKNPRVLSISKDRVLFEADLHTGLCRKNKITVDWYFYRGGTFRVAKPCQAGKLEGRFFSATRRP